jgi:putative hydrolase of the HAD superfamily
VGLADLLKVDRKLMRKVGEDIYPLFSLSRTYEEEYWQRFSEGVGQQLDLDTVKSIENQTMSQNPFLFEFLGGLQAKGITLGMISNNSTFWFSKQVSGLLGKFFSSDDIFLSCEQGVPKRAESPNLFEVARSKLDPQKTLIIDDRKPNLVLASRYGFQTLHYESGSQWDSAGYWLPPKYLPF